MIYARDKQGSPLWLGDYVELPEAYAKVVARIIAINVTAQRARVYVTDPSVDSIHLPLSDLLKVTIVSDM